MMDYRIIALDLDGTLLNDAGTVSPEDLQALQAVAARGVTIVFASGRMTESIRLYTKDLHLDGPLISYNGAMLNDSRACGEGILFHMPLSAAHADELIAYTSAERFHLNYYLDETLYAREDPTLRRFSDIYHSRTGSEFCFVPDLGRFKGNSPTKLILITDPSDPEQPDPRHRDELYARWQDKWAGQVDLVRTDPEYLEFMNPGANKGTALAALARHLGVAQEQVIAIGDGRNDTPMIAWAGLGVAVANAKAEVLATAKYISPKTNNESAVAGVIKQFVGI